MSLDSLARDRFFELTRRDALDEVLAGLEAAEAYPELRPIKVNAVALRDFTEDEALRFAELARRKPYEVRFIEFMPLDADRTWGPDRVLPNDELRAIIHATYPLEPLGPAALGHVARAGASPTAQGTIGFISPVSQPFCCGLQPHPPDRRRPAAHLPVLAQRDRPARAAARRRDRRRARGDRPRRGLAQGAQAPHQRAGLRAARALDVPDRRLGADQRGHDLVVQMVALLAGIGGVVVDVRQG